MKARTILWAAAAIALAACNKGGTANNTSATGGGTASVPVKPVQPPANGDWTTVTSETTAGGFMMVRWWSQGAQLHPLDVKNRSFVAWNAQRDVAFVPPTRNRERVRHVISLFRQRVVRVCHAYARLVPIFISGTRAPAPCPTSPKSPPKRSGGFWGCRFGRPQMTAITIYQRQRIRPDMT